MKIKENSWVAKLASIKLKANSVAIVIGNTIHLHNCNEQNFLQDERWVKHELCHIRQFKQHGFFTFICKYLLECVRNGYYQNIYEVEARQAEAEPGSL